MNVTNESVLDCSHGEYYGHEQYMIKVWLMVPCIVFGLLTNSLNILVFWHKPMRTSLVNWYILALCFSDLSILLSSFFMSSLPALMERTDTLLWLELSSYAMRITYPLAVVTQTINVYLTVAVSAHRFFGYFLTLIQGRVTVNFGTFPWDQDSVCYPFKAKRILHGKFVKSVILCVVLFGFVFNAPKFFEVTLRPCLSELTGTESLSIAPTQLLDNRTYFLTYRVLAYSLVMFFIPFVVLIVVNSLIIRTLLRSTRKRQAMTMKRPSHSHSQARGSREGTSNAHQHEHMLLNEYSRSASAVSGNISVSPSPCTEQPKAIQAPSSHRLSILTTISNNNNNNSDTLNLHKRKASKLGDKDTLQTHRDRKTTIMMLAIVGVFLLCNLLPFACNIVQNLDLIYPGTVLGAHLFSVLVELANLSVVLNSASSIVIYYWFGSKYRKIVKGLFGRDEQDPELSVRETLPRISLPRTLVTTDHLDDS